MRGITSINRFRLTICVLNDPIKLPLRNKRVAIALGQQIFASLQPYIKCLQASEDPLLESPPWEKLVSLERVLP